MRSCLILGAGRSGTSMLAGALHAAGYHMGDELLAPTSSNPKGYFEDRTVNEINEDLLLDHAPLRPSGRQGRLYPWRLPYGYRWLAVVDPRAQVRATPELLERMRRVVSQRPFCLKDPRFCYTLEAWRQVLGEAAFLCVFREPGRSASSVLRAGVDERDYLHDVRLSRRRAIRVWSSMYRHVLEKHMHLGQWEFVHYDQFLDGSALPRLERLLDVRIDAGFADARLKRSSSHRRVPASAAALYDELCELASFAPPAPRRARPDAPVIPSVKGTA
jgi:hypothetical protein